MATSRSSPPSSSITSTARPRRRHCVSTFSSWYCRLRRLPASMCRILPTYHGVSAHTTSHPHGLSTRRACGRGVRCWFDVPVCIVGTSLESGPHLSGLRGARCPRGGPQPPLPMLGEGKQTFHAAEVAGSAPVSCPSL